MTARRLAAAVALVALLAAALLADDWAPVKRKPKADRTGMIPGDVVMGNLVRFPGHAGLYIGKWRDLPPALRNRYNRLHEHQFATASRNAGLKETYLVVDSYDPGVRVRSLAEQFTGYFSENKVHSAAALKWEADGAAFAYLPDDDMRRWRVVEEALKMAKAKVAFPPHPRRVSAKFVKNYRQTATEDAHLDDAYGKHPMDCITMVYVAHWRGAKMKLELAGEKSLLNWYLMVARDPRFSDVDEVTMTAPIIKSMLSKLSGKRRGGVDLKPVYIEAAMLGLWSGTPKVTVGKKAEATPFALLNLPHRSGKEDEKIKEFETFRVDPETVRATSDEPTVSIAELKPDGRIVSSGSRGESTWRYVFDPKTETLEIDTAIHANGKVTTTRGLLKRGRGHAKAASKVDYELTVQFRKPAWRRGPVRAQIFAAEKGKRGWGGPAMVKAPYLIVVQLGAREQYLYPMNAVYPGVKVVRGRIMRFSRFDYLHVQALQETALPATMTVTAILPDGQRLSKEVAVPYTEHARPEWALRGLKYREEQRAKMKAALALPATDRTRAIKIARPCANVMRWTTNREDASDLWRIGREAIRGAEKHYLSVLQNGQLEGALLRGDVALYRTIVTEREKAGKATAHQILTLMEMLVRHNNDVAAARSYWPKFNKAVGKMPPAEAKRFHYDRAIKETLILPAQPIKP